MAKPINLNKINAAIDHRAKRLLMVRRSTNEPIGMFENQLKAFEVLNVTRHTLNDMLLSDGAHIKRKPDWFSEYKIMFASEYEKQNYIIFQGGQLTLE